MAKTLPLIIATVLASSALSSCDSIDSAKNFFQGEALNPTRLEISIEPDAGLKIYIDGQLKGDKSPYLDSTISYGTHMLKVTAPGFYPIEMPIEVTEGKKVAFPLALRVNNRPVEGNALVNNNGNAAQTPSSANNVDSKATKGNANRVAVNENGDSPVASVAEAPAPVAEMRNKLSVRLGLDPECSVYVDGKKMGKGTSVPVTFNKSFGKLKIRFDDEASMDFTYQLSTEGRLEVKPKNSGTNWRRNGAKVDMERYYFIGLQPVRFEAQTGPDHIKQAAIFKVLEEGTF